MYNLNSIQILPISLEEAWNFFSSPLNLQKITPAYMEFKILSEVPKEIYPGLIIPYTIKPIAGITMKWVTEITHVHKVSEESVQDHSYFVDVQLSGPYKSWHHEHHFRKIEGGIEMKDILYYELPFGFLGRVVHKAYVRKKVEEIFDYRFKVLGEMYG